MGIYKNKFQTISKVFLSISIVFPFVSIVFLLSQSLSQSAAPTNGLVGYWKFDEGTGTTATDSAGSNTGALTNGPSWVAGKVGSGALSFDGSNDVVTTGSDFIGTSALTISVWIYPRSFGQSTALILDNGKTQLKYGYANRLDFSSNGGTTRPFSASTGSFNQWVHAVVTRDALGVISFYVNGILSGAANQSSGAPEAGTANVRFGNSLNGVHTFDGVIDEMRIYSRVLSPAEIYDIYNDMGSTSSPPPAPPPPPPADTTPPVISSIAPANVNQASASISWTTDEPSDTQIDYGLTTGYGSQTALDTNLATNHSQPLSGLSSGTLYNYRVRSRDASGNLSISSNNTFTTASASPPPAPPAPSPTPPPSSGTVNAATCNQSDVQTAVNAATSGGTVNVPAGNCTWPSAVNVTKALSIIGAGSGTGGTRLTAATGLSNGFFNITNLTSSSLLRISGFYFDLVNLTIPYGIKMFSNNSLDQVRIDHNVFNGGSVAHIEINGAKGVIDHNYFYNGIKAISFSAGTREQADASWMVMAAGTGDALFIEDNQIIVNANYQASFGQEKIGTYNGGKLVMRYNNFDASQYHLSTTFSPFMSHGSACGGCNDAW